MNRDKTMSLREAFHELLSEESELHEGMMEHRLIQSLPLILPMISSYIGSAQIRDSVLYLRIRSSTIKHQLSMEKERLIRQLNDYLKCELIRDIVLL